MNWVGVGGLEDVRADYEMPLRYGVDQCIGDTIGPGGIFKALRTGPVWLEIVADMARLAPRALVINYSNPMSILTLSAAPAAEPPGVRLCHSHHGAVRQLPSNFHVPFGKITRGHPGVNNNTWVPH